MSRPLVVDLDHTFILNDTFILDLKRIILRITLADFFLVIKILCIYLFSSRAKAKSIAANSYSSIKIDYKINLELLNFLQKSSQPLILLSGANERHVRKIANSYPIFKEHYGSNDTRLLSVKNKINWLEEQKITNFDYLADRFGDRALFKLAKISYFANPSWLLIIAQFFDKIPIAGVFHISKSKNFILKLAD